MRRTHGVLLAVMLGLTMLSTLVSIAGAAPAAAAPVLPAQFTDTVVASVGQPTAIAFLPDGRMLVTTQPGRLRVVSGGTLATDPRSRPLRTDLQQLRARPARRRRRPRRRVQGVLRLLHRARHQLQLPDGLGQPGGSADEPGLTLRDPRRQHRRPRQRDDPARRHLLQRRQPQRGRPAGRQGRSPLRQHRRRRLRLQGRQRLCGEQRRRARPEHPQRQDPAHHPLRWHPGGQPLRRCRLGVLQDRAHAGRARPAGDLRHRSAQPVPDRIRPERERHVLPHQRRRSERLGGDRPGRQGRRLRLERARGTLRQHRLGVQLRRRQARPVHRPGARLRAQHRLRVHHRRCVRAERHLAVAYTGAYLFSDYVCGKIFALSPEWGTRTDFVTGLGGSSAVHLAFGPYAGSQALYYTTLRERRRDPPHRLHRRRSTGHRPPYCLREPHVGPGPADDDPQRVGQQRPRRQPAHLPVELRRRQCRRDDVDRDDPAHLSQPAAGRRRLRVRDRSAPPRLRPP